MTTTAPPPATRSQSEAITAASRTIHELMTVHGRLTRQQIRNALDSAFLTAEQSWWEISDAHEACEAATAGMLFAEGAMQRANPRGDDELDRLVEQIAADEPRIRGKALRHAQRQHYATAIRIGWAMALSAGIENDEVVLDPSAGTGTLLALARLACPEATLHANEGTGIRAATLRATAPDVEVHEGDAMTLATDQPTWRDAHDVVLMNPPASARIGDGRKHRNEDLRHLRAAAGMVRANRRIVALLSGGTKPRERAWEDIIEGSIRLAWCALIDGSLAENREHAASSLLCVLDNRAEDDGFDPTGNTERYVNAQALWAGARAAART